MKNLKKYWLVAVFGGLLMATLVGVAAARPNDRPHAAITRFITVPAAHFVRDDNLSGLYDNVGYRLDTLSPGIQGFVAPVVFPTGRAVVVESITLRVYDNNATGGICVSLRKTDPMAADEVTMASVCSSGASSQDPRSFHDLYVVQNPVKHQKGIYLKLYIDDNIDLEAYAVRIQYHIGTT